MKACSLLGVMQIFASYNTPQGNADNEQVIRTIKEDFVWFRDFSSPAAFIEGFRHWFDNYNTDYPHSSLNYLTPCQFEKQLLLLANN